MTTGGFVAADYAFICYPRSGNDSSYVELKVKEILSGVTQAIISTNQGWVYDSNYTESSSSFVQIGTGTSVESKRFAQFLINTITGSKLLVAYTPTPSSNLFDFSVRVKNNGAYYSSGLSMSMIPGGSNNTWDVSENCTTKNLISEDGTPIIGTVIDSNSKSTFLSYDNVSQRQSRYVVVVKQDVIHCFWQDINSGYLNGCISVGKIFGNLCNSNDSGLKSKYGAITFIDGNVNGETYYGSGSSYAPNLNIRGNGFSLYCIGANNCSWLTMACFAADGEKRTGWSTFLMNTNPVAQFGYATQSSTSNKTAFGAFLCGVNLNNLDASVGIVPGNGFKGYLDTDIFRSVYYEFPYNTLLDDGKFIYVGSGLAIGWDASNEVLLRT
jgi:hypothetical protein